MSSPVNPEGINPGLVKQACQDIYTVYGTYLQAQGDTWKIDQETIGKPLTSIVSPIMRAAAAAEATPFMGEDLESPAIVSLKTTFTEEELKLMKGNATPEKVAALRHKILEKIQASSQFVDFTEKKLLINNLRILGCLEYLDLPSRDDLERAQLVNLVTRFYYELFSALNQSMERSASGPSFAKATTAEESKNIIEMMHVLTQLLFKITQDSKIPLGQENLRERLQEELKSIASDNDHPFHAICTAIDSEVIVDELFDNQVFSNTLKNYTIEKEAVELAKEQAELEQEYQENLIFLRTNPSIFKQACEAFRSEFPESTNFISNILEEFDAFCKNGTEGSILQNFMARLELIREDKETNIGLIKSQLARIYQNFLSKDSSQLKIIHRAIQSFQKTIPKEEQSSAFNAWIKSLKSTNYKLFNGVTEDSIHSQLHVLYKQFQIHQKLLDRLIILLKLRIPKKEADSLAFRAWSESLNPANFTFSENTTDTDIQHQLEKLYQQFLIDQAIHSSTILKGKTSKAIKDWIISLKPENFKFSGETTLEDIQKQLQTLYQQFILIDKAIETLKPTVLPKHQQLIKSWIISLKPENFKFSGETTLEDIQKQLQTLYQQFILIDKAIETLKPTVLKKHNKLTEAWIDSLKPENFKFYEETTSKDVEDQLQRLYGNFLTAEKALATFIKLLKSNQVKDAAIDNFRDWVRKRTNYFKEPLPINTEKYFSELYTTYLKEKSK